MGTITDFSIARNRTLHLVDIENLIGDPVAIAPVVHETLDQYRELAGWQPGDHAIVAANPLAGAPPEWVVKRFARVVIGSGDHIFAPRARTLQDMGVQVTIVSRSESLSGALQGQGFAVRILTTATKRPEPVRAA